MRTTGQLEEEEKAQEQEENRGQGNIECVHLDWQQCLDRIWDFFCVLLIGEKSARRQNGTGEFCFFNIKKTAAARSAAERKRRINPRNM